MSLVLRRREKWGRPGETLWFEAANLGGGSADGDHGQYRSSPPGGVWLPGGLTKEVLQALGTAELLPRQAKETIRYCNLMANSP
ncbi:MAG: hypothetical protein FJ012_09110 [Chloroflexi bacterium]|nr:hypothetical protein [Chloroflexota bacterium]